LLPAEADDVLELDEVWSFVFIKTAKFWLWTSNSRYELVQVDFSQATGKDRIAYTFDTEVTQNTAKLVIVLSKS